MLHGGRLSRRFLRGLLPAVIALSLFSADAVAGNTLRCEPALPFFCKNIHIGCAGRTRMETGPFKILLSGDSQAIVIQEKTAWSGDLTVGEDGRSFVVRLTGKRDWIKVEGSKTSPTLRYSERLYTQRGPVMSRGTCEVSEPRG